MRNPYRLPINNTAVPAFNSNSIRMTPRETMLPRVLTGLVTRRIREVLTISRFFIRYREASRYRFGVTARAAANNITKRIIRGKTGICTAKNSIFVIYK